MKIPQKYLLFGPTFLYGLGFLLNALVIAANHGQMPVLYPGGCHSTEWALAGDEVHSCMMAATRLKFLADWVLIKDFGVASPGDFLLWAGQMCGVPALALWIYERIRTHNAA